MSEIDFKVHVDTRRLTAAFDALPDELRDRLIEPVSRITEIMHERITAAEPYRTGELREHTLSDVRTGHDWVRGRVYVAESGAHRVKAAALEYGAHGVAHVAAHAMTLDHVWGDMMAAESVLVSEYQRRVNVPAFEFLRHSVEGMNEMLKDAVERNVAEMNRGLGGQLA